MKAKPLISIVIANYNYGRFLEAAIRSVIDQECFGDCELIIVDGGSTDNSVDIIKKYAGKITWWVSEQDRGQSDAFNKGFARSRGKYLTWLNADDLLMPGCLAKTVRVIRKHPECEWFTGNMFRFDNTGTVIEIGWGPHYLPAFLQRKDSPTSIAVYGPTSFFSKKIFNQVGGMDINLVNTMDYDLWIKFAMAGIKQRRINCFCWAFRMHEASKSAEYGTHKVTKEVRDMISREGEIIRGRSGYHPRNFWHKVTMLWRIFDGSLVRHFYLCWRVRHMNQFFESY